MKVMLEVTCALIIKEDKVLIVQRSEHMHHPLKWEFPGGKIKTGETPEKCIRREIMEELHASIEVEQLLPSVMYDYEDKRIKLIPFVCSLISEDITLEQHREFSWIKKSEVKQYDLLPPDVEVLKYLSGNWK